MTDRGNITRVLITFEAEVIGDYRAAIRHIIENRVSFRTSAFDGSTWLATVVADPQGSLSMCVAPTAPLDYVESPEEAQLHLELQDAQIKVVAAEARVEVARQALAELHALVGGST